MLYSGFILEVEARDSVEGKKERSLKILPEQIDESRSDLGMGI